ncbi:TRAP transporter substrate-binding protein [Acuticoccus sp. MNP-M23]|uniref:TRAP transporter substrate-binding protein n=1 Tax=Acuticoccus sp. MNP-M23 TaxID=3072793 RepID=UPI0028159757|nr:TRAP transporter substrate-binding protein [Acuticoccus sp. MNP-M23]WMS42382.1 TRAP transporter substrate-binding protein [Acuticoccus sp. MNP-M23]
MGLKSKFALGVLLASMAMPVGAMAQEITVGLSLPENMAGLDFANGMYETFRDEVEANSDLTVNLVYGGALGSPNDRLAQMRRGLIQMSDTADGNLATVFSDVMVFNTPYLFPSEEVAWEVLDGPLGDKLAQSLLDKTGIRALGWWESGGFKHFSANREIHSPADMDGLKIRVLGPLATIPVEAMGASAAPISFGELYTALQTRVVDGQDNSVAVFKLVNLFEVQDTLALTGHVYAFGPLGINNAFYEGLTDPQRAVIDAAAEKAIAFNRETSRALEADAIAFVADKGVNVITLTDDEKAAFRDVMQPAAIEWLRTEMQTPELIDEALAAVEAAGK